MAAQRERTKRGNGKYTTAGAGNAQTKRSSAKIKYISTCGICLLCGVAGVILYFSFGIASTNEACLKYFESVKTKKLIKGMTMNPIKMHACRMQACTFDVKQCQNPCPFSLESDDEGCPCSCKCATSGVYQGDIQFNQDQLPQLLESYGYSDENTFGLFFDKSYDIWDNIVVNGRKKVPYELSLKIGLEAIETWNVVIEDFSKRSCIDLVHHKDEKDYIVLLSSSDCSTTVGRLPGAQQISLGQGCGYRSIIQHELLHTFGFNYEQSRPDRDAYVNIHEENIQEYYLNNFDKMNENPLLDLQSPYEVESTLHYRSDAFAISGKYSITLKPGDDLLNDSDGGNLMTDEDVRELNLLYKCDPQTEGGVEGQWKDWESWSACSVSCDEGFQTRLRTCMDASGNEIHGCPGKTIETQVCNAGKCPPPNGIWDPWTEWTECSHSCDAGKKVRFRSCPEKKYSGGCWSPWGNDHFSEKKICKKANCDGTSLTPIEAAWTEWTEASPCNATCGGGILEMTKWCRVYGKYETINNCDENFESQKQYQISSGNLRKFLPCNTAPCRGLEGGSATVETTSSPGSEWSEWGQWGGCDALCGGGKKLRVRKCMISYCSEEAYGSSPCNEHPCSGSPSSGGQLLEETMMSANMICSYGKIVIGNMNDDKMEDMIQIHFSNGLISDTIGWEGKTEVCKHLTETQRSLHVKDVDGDGIDDLICLNKITKSYEVAINRGGKFESKIDWSGQRPICRGPTEILNVFDMNGDGKSDMVCGDKTNAFKKLLLHIKD